jgi:hypothetical protein
MKRQGPQLYEDNVIYRSNQTPYGVRCRCSSILVSSPSVVRSNSSSSRFTLHERSWACCPSVRPSALLNCRPQTTFRALHSTAPNGLFTLTCAVGYSCSLELVARKLVSRSDSGGTEYSVMVPSIVRFTKTVYASSTTERRQGSIERLPAEDGTPVPVPANTSRYPPAAILKAHAPVQAAEPKVDR